MAWWWHHAPALIVYRDPGEGPISFGDIFEGKHLIDVHARLQTRRLGGGNMPRTAAERIARAVNRPLSDPGETVPMYTPALPQRPEDFHVLAYGGATMKRDEPLRAILLSDSCAIDTALGTERGRRAQGRLLFAPMIPTTETAVEALEEQPLFGRLPLTAAPGKFGWGTAELRDCFMVDARDVRKEDRILTLTADAAEDLEAAWDACALRRGPHVVEHNVTKLAHALAGEDGDAEEQAGAVEMIQRTLVVAWRLEGGLLRAAADSPVPDKAALKQIVAELKELEESARAAHERLARALE
jgi:hypothetical protein